MKNRRGFAAVAACAALTCASVAGAANTAPAQKDAFSLTEPVFAVEQSRTPLMHLLDQAGMAAALDDARITLGGWVEASWTHNFDDPAGNLNAGRIFDIEHDDHTLNQVVFFADRSIEASPDKVDVGGRMEWMWGGDARFIHSNGLFDHYGFSDGPDEQFDLTQLYVTVNVPVGNGVLVKAGKFATHCGYETINPTTNPLYSHSFLFNFAIPLTHTGVTATYGIDENWSATVGVIRGWDQSLEDNNDSHAYLGQIAYTSEKLDGIFNFITGPEQTDNERDWRTVFDLVVVYREGDNLKFVFNGDWGRENDAGVNGKDAQWWGAAGYVIYTINDYCSAVGRLEFFADDDGARLGVDDLELWAATVGVNIKPMPNDTYGQNLVLRPEIRYDSASENVFDGLGDDNQFTFGVDAIFVY